MQIAEVNGCQCNEYCMFSLYSRAHTVSSELCKNLSDIPIDAYAVRGDVIGRVSAAEVYAGVDRLRVPHRHLPEGVFDNDGGVMFIAHHFFGDHLRLMFWQHSGLHK